MVDFMTRWEKTGDSFLEKLVIKGKTPLKGEVIISGAKNSAVALIPATLLINGTCTIDNLPNISDVRSYCDLIETLGAKVTWNNEHEVTIDSSNLTSFEASPEITRKFRASYYLIGSLLGRCGHAKVGMAGGCNLGQRPIDLHIKGFEALGASVDDSNGNITATAKKLKGTNIYMDVVSVGATINIMLAAVLAEGTTIIDNAAKEPHVVDLATVDMFDGAVKAVEAVGQREFQITGADPVRIGVFQRGGLFIPVGLFRRDRLRLRDAPHLRGVDLHAADLAQKAEHAVECAALSAEKSRRQKDCEGLQRERYGSRDGYP